MSSTLLLVSTLALSEMSLSIAPLFLMLSSMLLMNYLSDFMQYTSETKVLVPTKTYVQVSLLSIAGVFEYTVSVATGSDLCFTFKAGKGE